MGGLNPQLLLIIALWICFLALVEVQVVLSKGITIKCSKMQVIKCLAGLRHITKNVSAVCNALCISGGLSKFTISLEFPGLRTAFKAASLVDILLAVSHPVRAWSAGRHLMSSSPRLCRYHGVVI